MTDNHFRYKPSTDLTEAMADLTAKHVFIRPHCPWLEFSNTGRRHSAIGGLPPISRLS